MYVSDSQPGCRSTLGCLKEVSGCRQISNYRLFIDDLLQRVPQIVIFNQVGVPPIFFKNTLKNTDLLCNFITSTLWWQEHRVKARAVIQFCQKTSEEC
jgi:hypothetical protein